MNERSSPTVALSVLVVKNVLFGFILILASLTVFTQVLQFFGAAFRAYAAVGVIVFLLAAASLFLVIKKNWPAEVNCDRTTLLLVLAAGLLGAALAISNRTPDDDDFYYVPNAVYYVQNPDQPLNYDIRAVQADDGPFQEVITFTSFPYEYIQAVLAYFTGLETLFVYHLVFPALIGFLIPLAFYLALARLHPEAGSANAYGVFVILAAILLLGETPWTIGSLSFARAFQGKIIFLALGPILFTAFSYEFFEHRDRFAWLSLFLLAIAMLGLTATVIAMFPALAMVLGLVRFTTSKQTWRERLREIIFYGSSLGYVLAYALIVRSNALSTHGMDAPQNSVWPVTFIGHLKLLISPQWPVTPVVAVVAFALALALSPRRRDVFLWTVFSCLIFLNPWTAPLVIRYLTSPNIYWRMFYILPFPLVIGVGASSLLVYMKATWNTKAARLFVMLSLFALAGLHLPLRGSSVFQAPGGMRLGWPAYKVDPQELSLARAAAEAAPPGPMLAPLHFGGTLTLIDSGHPQMITRKVGIVNWLTYRGKTQDARLRVESSAFVNGESTDFASFKRLVRMYPNLRSIVMLETLWQRQEVRSFVEENGFTFHQPLGEKMILLWR